MEHPIIETTGPQPNKKESGLSTSKGNLLLKNFVFVWLKLIHPASGPKFSSSIVASRKLPSKR